MSAEQFSFSFEAPASQSIPKKEQEAINQELLDKLSDEELLAKYKDVIGYTPTLRFFSEDLAERRQQIIDGIVNKDVELARIGTLTREEDREELRKDFDPGAFVGK
jgi:hypothetical protein